MPAIPNMLMIGSAGRNVGKTELACSLIRRFSANIAITGLKVTTVTRRDGTCPRGGRGCGVCSSLTGNYCITEEHGHPPDKDTSRLLAAGAERVYWLRAMRSHLREAFKELHELVGSKTVSICESNSLRLVVEPGLFLMVKDRTATDCKPSADAVKNHADVTITFNGHGFDRDLSPIDINRGRWTWLHDATAVILAGGNSTRMEENKAMLPIGDRPMLEHIYDQLVGNFAEIIASSNTPETLSFLGVPTVPDREPGKGPLMGIASALRRSGTDLNFVTGCDIPDIPMPFVRHMLESAHGYDAVVPRTRNGLIEPLFAVYRRNVGRIMDAILDAGGTRVRDVFDNCRTRYVDVPASRHLRNLNTRRDYEAYVAERKRNGTL